MLYSNIFRVSVSRSKDVAPFGPPIPESAMFNKSKKFADFLLAKGIGLHICKFGELYCAQSMTKHTDIFYNIFSDKC